MNEVISLLTDTENKLIANLQDRKLKESKQLFKLWGEILNVLMKCPIIKCH